MPRHHAAAPDRRLIGAGLRSTGPLPPSSSPRAAQGLLAIPKRTGPCVTRRLAHLDV